MFIHYLLFVDNISWLITTNWWRVVCVQEKIKIKYWPKCTFLTKEIPVLLNFNKDSLVKICIDSSVSVLIIRKCISKYSRVPENYISSWSKLKLW